MLLPINLLLEAGQLVLMGTLFALKGDVVFFETLGFDSACVCDLFTKLVKQGLQFLRANERLILAALFDELLLLSLDITDLLVDVHLLLVVGRFVLHSLVQKLAEIIGLMDAVDEHSK